MTSLEAHIALNMIDGVGPATYAKLRAALGDAVNIFSASESQLSSIAGISAVCEAGGASLCYEDLALGLGTLPGTELSPAQAPSRLVRAWAQAWIASAGADGAETLACYDDGDLTVRTWFDAGGVPVRAELAVDGRVYFSAELRNFTWKAGNEHETAKENLG